MTRCATRSSPNASSAHCRRRAAPACGAGAPIRRAGARRPGRLPLCECRSYKRNSARRALPPPMIGRAALADVEDHLRPQRTQSQSARHARAGDLRPLHARGRREAVPVDGGTPRLCRRVPTIQPRGRHRRLDTGGAREGRRRTRSSTRRATPRPRSRFSTRCSRWRRRSSRCTSPTFMPASRFATTPMCRSAARAVICGFGVEGYALAIAGLAAMTAATQGRAKD